MAMGDRPDEVFLPTLMKVVVAHVTNVDNRNLASMMSKKPAAIVPPEKMNPNPDQMWPKVEVPSHLLISPRWGLNSHNCRIS